jgi:hypothetical protein
LIETLLESINAYLQKNGLGCQLTQATNEIQMLGLKISEQGAVAGAGL